MNDNKNDDLKLYDNLQVEHKDGSEVEIEGEIPLAAIDMLRSDTLKKLAKNAEIDGFRKGHVPESVIASRLGEVEIMKEIAEDILSRAYADIVLTNNLDVIGRPAVSITKLAPGNPIGFKIRTAVMPQITLPDYKKIAADVTKDNIDESRLFATHDDVQAVIDDIRKREAGIDMTPSEDGRLPEIDEKELPEFTGELAQKLGDFKNVDDFKEKIKKNIGEEKKYRAREERRIKIADGIVEATNVDLPLIFVESELEKMVHEFKTNVARMGLDFNQYLERVKKTEQQLRGEWEPEAKKRATLQLALNEIAKQENIKPDEQKVERDVAHILEHYNDADAESARVYVETMMTNDLVFAALAKENE